MSVGSFCYLCSKNLGLNSCCRMISSDILIYPFDTGVSFEELSGHIMHTIYDHIRPVIGQRNKNMNQTCQYIATCATT